MEAEMSTHPRTWLFLLLGAAAIVGSVLAFQLSGTKAAGNTMVIVGPGAPVGSHQDFTVDVSVTAASTAFTAYLFSIPIPAGLSGVGGERIAGNPFSPYSNCAPDATSATYGVPAGGPAQDYCDGAATTYEGVYDRITLHCGSDGTYNLDFDPDNTYMRDSNGDIVTDLTLTGTSVTCESAVGGIAELPAVEPEAVAARAESSGPNSLAVAGLAVAGALLLATIALYARRRWLR
jgi:hypothetical protein